MSKCLLVDETTMTLIPRPSREPVNGTAVDEGGEHAAA